MKVLKFGGTSVGSAERIQAVARLILERGCNIVVLSAMSGTTNTLVEIAGYLYKGNLNGAKEIINNLEKQYRRTVALLFSSVDYRMEADEQIGGFFSHIRAMAQHPGFSEVEEKEILAMGEMMSTTLMYLYLLEQGHKPVFLPALDFMLINDEEEADEVYLRGHLQPLLDAAPADTTLFITQGYICRNSRGEVDNLHRGGSDLTACLIGGALELDEIEIWTDIDGMHNADPRFVADTHPVAELGFEEAAELAYFGAKILHPSCVLPAKVNNVPIRLLNTMEPAARGTLIHNVDTMIVSPSLKAVAAKDGITAIRIRSSRMLGASRFVHRVFEIFDAYRRPIDLVSTSEVAVTVTVDSTLKLEHIIDELKEIGTVTVDADMAIVTVVGDAMAWTAPSSPYAARALEALSSLPVRMICYGGSDYNIAVLLRSADKAEALRLLAKALF